MDLTGIKTAVATLAQLLPKETAQVFDRVDLTVQQAVSHLDELLTKHEAVLGNFLDGFEVTMTIQFKRKQP